mmetsp:Transcript_17375/g.52411  ORF Transcript_17375/g.52411 Transcript_17375/m.52411 type:complete len:266 (+) Transcript_17375:703-1500(+)
MHQLRGPRARRDHGRSSGQDLPVDEPHAGHSPSLDHQLLGLGREEPEVDASELCCLRKGAGGAERVGGTVTRGPDTADPLPGEARQELLDALLVEHLCVQAVLLRERHPLLELHVPLLGVAERQVADVLPAHGVPELLLQALPALHGLLHEPELPDVPPLLPAEAPGLGRLRGADASRVEHRDARPPQRQVVCRGAPDDAAAHDQDVGPLQCHVRRSLRRWRRSDAQRGHALAHCRPQRLPGGATHHRGHCAVSNPPACILWRQS